MSESTRDVVRRYYETLAARDWAGFGTTLADDVRYEMPQTRERLHGRDAYVRWNREFPGDWRFEITRLIADEQYAAGTMTFRVDGQAMLGISFFELDASGLISRITDVWPEPYEPPAGREHLIERAADLTGFIDEL